MANQYPSIGDEIRIDEHFRCDNVWKVRPVWGTLVAKVKSGIYVDYEIEFINYHGQISVTYMSACRAAGKWRKKSVDTEEKLSELLDTLYG